MRYLYSDDELYRMPLNDLIALYRAALALSSAHYDSDFVVSAFQIEVVIADRTGLNFVQILALSQGQFILGSPTPQQDAAAVAAWVYSNVPYFETEQQADAFAALVIGVSGYDRKQPIKGNKLGWYEFDIPAPATLL